MRVVVQVRLVLDELALLFEALHDRLVRLEDGSYRPNRRPRRCSDPRRRRGRPIRSRFLQTCWSSSPKPGGHVDDASSFGRVDELGTEHAERVRVSCEVREHRPVRGSDELRSEERSLRLGALQLGRVLLGHPGADDERPPVLRVDGVLDLGAHRQGEVRRQGPGSRGPDPDVERCSLVLALELEAHGHRGVLPLAVGVVDPRLEVRDDRLGRPRVRHDA